MEFEDLFPGNNKLKASTNIAQYHEDLKQYVFRAMKVATEAKEKGFDPKKEVEIYIAQDVASRTEGLVGPKGVGKRLKELEKTLPKDKIVIKIAQEIAKGDFGKGTIVELAEQALRTALSYQTEGITAAPIEGISKVTLKTNPDGTDYLAIYYAGPIRSAGGTAQGVSVYIADEIRKVLGIERYRATDKEVERMLEETRLYNKIMHLQLPTSDEELRHAWRNIPIMITGDPTEKEEVGGYRDIESMDSNRVRGGAALVLNDGLVGRAKKITKRTKKLKLEGWEWLDEIASGKYTDARETESKSGGKPTEVTPDYSFSSDALMGRPTFSDATARGGFRLRYGHARNTGIAGIGIHPGAMAAVDDFLAPGTHVRTERPGKGSIVVPISSVKPPIVLLDNGDVIELESYEEGQKVQAQITKILFMGDMLVGVGEFFQNNYRLVPPGYNEEWWALEMIEKGWDARNKDEHELKFFERIYCNPPGAKEAIELANTYDVPLHPKYTPAWIYCSIDEIKLLHENLGKIVDDQTILPQACKPILELALIPHTVSEKGLDVGEMIHALKVQLPKQSNYPEDEPENGFELVQQLSKVTIRDIMGTTIGARMGRPEKAKARLMSPTLHGLFPVSAEKSIRKMLSNALEKEYISVKLGNRYCTSCNKGTFKVLCGECGKETRLRGKCINPRCGVDMDEEPCDICGSRISYTRYYKLDLREIYEETSGRLFNIPPVVKLKDQLKNPSGIPELLDKGIMRARYNLNVFRDGTIRYDATDAPLTHFYPKEIFVSPKRLVELGYTHDIFGEELTRDDQLLEIKPQDIIVHHSIFQHFFDVSKFVDEELTAIYGMDPFYNIQNQDDLLGHLVIGLAPHTSAGVIGRLIGYTRSSVCWAHPFWHSSKRRNCLDYDEELLLWDTETGSFMKRPIGELVEGVSKCMNGEIVDDYGTMEFKNPHNTLHAFSIDETTNETILQPIKSWVKGTTDSWITVTTESGKTITMTPDHNQLVWDGKKLFRKKARDLIEGDEVPILHHLSQDFIRDEFADNRAQINILQEFVEKLPKNEKFDKFKNDIRLRDAEIWMRGKLAKFAQLLYEDKGIGPNTSSLQSIQQLGPRQITTLLKKYFTDKLPRGTITKYFNPKWYTSIPLSHLEVLQLEGVFEWNEIPLDATLGIARNSSSTSPYIKMDENLMQLLGLFISEGYIRDEYGCYQVNFSIKHEKLHNYTIDLIENVFNSKPYSQDDFHTVCHVNKIHAYLFAYAWRMNKTALTKRIPEFIYGLPRNLRFSFLSAIIDGDGSLIDTHYRISIYTANKKLADDYALLINTLGSFVRIYHHKKVSYGKTVLDRYKELGKEPKQGNGLYHVNITGTECLPIIGYLNLNHPDKSKKQDSFVSRKYPKEFKFNKLSHNTIVEKIKSIEWEDKQSNTYCLEVTTYNGSNNITLASSVLSGQCDGDEDGVILLLDGFLNFSKEYLPTTRGSKMDTPLVLVATLNPAEVDDEAYNLDSMVNYTLDFYKAASEFEMPGTVAEIMHRAENRLNSADQFEGFMYSHPTQDIAEGPEITKYKSKELRIRDKLDVQLDLGRRISAVDVQQTALRILEKHALPDLLGNLRAFASQQVRCVSCNTKYRRVPLSGKCKNPNCSKSKIILTVPPKGVSKYFEICEMLVYDYNLGKYHEDRLEKIKLALESHFPDTSAKEVDLSEWF